MTDVHPDQAEARQRLPPVEETPEGRAHKVTRPVREKGENGVFVTVERETRLRPWYWHDLSGKWFIELRYANTVLALGKDQNAIEVGARDKLVPTIQTVIDAVTAGELDAAMNAALASRKKPGKTA